MEVSWRPDDGATFTTTGLNNNASWGSLVTNPNDPSGMKIQQAPVPVAGVFGNNAYTFNISARIGGANQDFSIDNLRIQTVGTTTLIDPSRRVELTNCTITPPNAAAEMLATVGTLEDNILLGFEPLPGGTYSSLYGVDKGCLLYTSPSPRD